ncbi:beta strand repeat-containing protein [Haloferula sargassicola]|uniref:Autotransporter-associated beta strand repeat-containing protein n=1 Tax=Haloferula sargassicola TaxID=490096 RepID=A0ABP9UY20_9BACT
MKPSRFNRWLPASVFAAAAISTAFSATVVWDGGPSATGTDLGLAENWVGDVLPSTATPDTAQWTGSPAGPLSLVYTATNSTLSGAIGNPGINLEVTATQTAALNIDSGANTASPRFNNLTIAAGAGPVSLGDGNDTFNFTLGGTSGQIHTWTNQSSNPAIVNADANPALGGTGSHAIAFTGSGDWQWAAPFDASNGANLSVHKTGTGQLTFSGGGTLAAGVTAYGGSFGAALKEGTTVISAGAYTSSGEFVVGGLDTTGGTETSLIMDAGSLNVANWLSLGRGNGAGAVSSNIILNGSAALSADNVSMGYNGGDATTLPKGSLTLNGASTFTVNGNGSLLVGESAGSDMTVTLNDTAQLVSAGTGAKRIGAGGSGHLVLGADAAVDFGNVQTTIGYRNGTGLMDMTGGTFTAGGEVRVGGSDVSGADSGSGVLNISGGTFTSNGLTFGRGNNNAALVNGTGTISGTAVVTCSGDLTLGYAGAANLGKLTLDGGTLHVGTTATKWLRVGVWDTSKGELNINGGTLKLNTNSSLKLNAEGTVGANVVHQTGGDILCYSDHGTTVGGTGNIDLQRSGAAASSNTYHFDGGTISTYAVVSTATTGTRTFNFNGGTLRPVAHNEAFFNLGDGTGVDRANIRDGGAIFDTNTFNVTVAQPLLHSDIVDDAAIDGGLTKLGAGNLTLSGDCTYTGPTAVTGGTLTLKGLIFGSSPNIAVTGGGKLALADYADVSTPVTVTEGALDGYGEIDDLTIANNAANTVTSGNGTANALYINQTLTFQGAARIDVQATGTTMNRYIDAGTGTLTTSAAGQITVNATNTSGAWTSGEDYPVIYYGDFAGSIAHFTLGTVPNLNPNQSASLVDTGSAIVIRITGESLVWKGTSGSNWDTSSNNWSYLGDPIAFSANSPVIFDDSATSFAVNLAADVSPSAIVFDNQFEPYTISSSGGFGILSGSVVKNGFETVTLSTDNSYTGTTVINEGTLKITGSGSIAESSSIAIGEDGTLILDLTSPDTYAHPITGEGLLYKQGSAALTLAGANTLTGDVYLEAGGLNLNSPTALGAAGGTFHLSGGTLDNTSGAQVDMTPAKAQIWDADVMFTGSNSLNMGNGAVTLGASRTVNVAANTLYAGAVGDGGSGYDLIKTGTGKLVLNGGDIRGDLDIQAGIVGINQDFLGGAPIGAGILQNDGAVATKWTFWYGPDDVTSNLLIRNNDGSHTHLLGIVKRNAGTLTLTNPSNVATANLAVDAGKLVVNGGTYGAQADDGTPNNGLTSVIGYTAAANAVLEINGATVNYNNCSNADAAAYRGTLDLGNNATGAGALKFNSGTLSIYRQLTLGRNGAYGSMSQTSGSASVGGFLALGLGTSTGSFDLSGGTFTQAGPVTNGAGADSRGVMNIRGNAVYNQTPAGDLGLWVGESGTGELNVSGTASLTLAADNNGLQLGRNATGAGTVNLLGGTVTTKAVTQGAGTGTLNFSGGTLKANAANTAFLNGLTHTYVHSAGGTIDNGGNAITIGQALETPAGSGISATGVTVGGGGFIGRPLVTVTGDGTGATAVADIDANGNLTGITVTNPGINYTTASFTLTGGGVGNTGTLGGAPSFVANASGSMTFTGNAITTLGGANTFTGNSIVAGGSSILLSNGASLTFAPRANGVSNKVTGAGNAYFYGAFNLDLSQASLANGNSWTLVDATGTKTYDPVTFSLAGFTAQGDGVTHIMVDGANTWTFSETTGLLSLSVSAVTGFDSWILGYGLDAADRGETADPDGDGIVNLLEYVLGGDPSVGDASIAPAAAKSGNNLVMTFKRSDASEGDVAASLQYGSGLASWTTVTVPAANGTSGGVTFTVVENGTDPDDVTATIPAGGSAKFFGRLQAVK